MTTQLRHTIVLLISDDSERDDEIGPALAAVGCIAHRAEPGSQLDGIHHYDAALLYVRRNSDWSAGLLTALRSAELACASLIVLESGGPKAIADSLRGGAVDCLVRPVGVPELLESLATAVDCTRRWRARVSLARARVIANAGPRRASVSRASSLSPVFEPVGNGPGSEAESRSDVKIEAVVGRIAEERGLTPRECEVLQWLLLGHRYDDIALVLGVAPRTAKFHAANLLQKLELDSRYDLPRLLAQEPDCD